MGARVRRSVHGLLAALALLASCGGAAAPANDGGVVSCDIRNVACTIAAPACASGQVPSIVNGCYGRCVGIETCACAAMADCPDPGTYTCHMNTMRCGPYVM